MVRLICFLRGHAWSGCVNRVVSGRRHTLTYICSRCHTVDHVSYLEKPR